VRFDPLPPPPPIYIYIPPPQHKTQTLTPPHKSSTDLPQGPSIGAHRDEVAGQAHPLHLARLHPGAYFFVFCSFFKYVFVVVAAAPFSGSSRMVRACMNTGRPKSIIAHPPPTLISTNRHTHTHTHPQPPYSLPPPPPPKHPTQHNTTQARGIIMKGEPPDVQAVYQLVVSELLHEGLTCALAAQRCGLLPGDGEKGGCVCIYICVCIWLLWVVLWPPPGRR
jgi:hypothetical protein